MLCLQVLPSRSYFILSATELLYCIFQFSCNFYSILSYIFCSFAKVLVFIHSPDNIAKYLYDHYLNSLSGRLLSPFHEFFFLMDICLILWFGTYSLISSFCLSVCLYVLGETATSLSLEGVVLCKNWFTWAIRAISLGHQTLHMGNHLMGCMCPPAGIEPALLFGEVRAQSTHPAQLWLGHCAGKVRFQLPAHHSCGSVSMLIRWGLGCPWKLITPWLLLGEGSGSGAYQPSCSPCAAQGRWVSGHWTNWVVVWVLNREGRAQCTLPAQLQLGSLHQLGRI